MSFSLVYLILFLLHLPTVCSLDYAECFSFPKASVYSDRDLVLGGFFPLCLWQEDQKYIDSLFGSGQKTNGDVLSKFIVVCVSVYMRVCV